MLLGWPLRNRTRAGRDGTFHRLRWGGGNEFLTFASVCRCFFVTRRANRSHVFKHGFTSVRERNYVVIFFAYFRAAQLVFKFPFAFPSCSKILPRQWFHPWNLYFKAFVHHLTNVTLANLADSLVPLTHKIIHTLRTVVVITLRRTPRMSSLRNIASAPAAHRFAVHFHQLGVAGFAPHNGMGVSVFGR